MVVVFGIAQSVQYTLVNLGTFGDESVCHSP